MYNKSSLRLHGRRERGSGACRAGKTGCTVQLDCVPHLHSDAQRSIIGEQKCEGENKKCAQTGRGAKCDEGTHNDVSGDDSLRCLGR